MLQRQGEGREAPLLKTKVTSSEQTVCGEPSLAGGKVRTAGNRSPGRERSLQEPFTALWQLDSPGWQGGENSEGTTQDPTSPALLPWLRKGAAAVGGRAADRRRPDPVSAPPPAQALSWSPRPLAPGAHPVTARVWVASRLTSPAACPGDTTRALRRAGQALHPEPWTGSGVLQTMPDSSNRSLSPEDTEARTCRPGRESCRGRYGVGWVVWLPQSCTFL